MDHLERIEAANRPSADGRAVGHALIVALAVGIVAMTTLRPGPSSYFDRPDVGLLTAHDESAAQRAVLDALEAEEAPVIRAGEWVAESPSPAGTTRYRLSLAPDGRFTLRQTTKVDGQVSSDEAERGTYEVRGQTIAFDHWVDGRRLHRRTPVEVDGTRLTLTSADDGRVRFTYLGSAEP